MALRVVQRVRFKTSSGDYISAVDGGGGRVQLVAAADNVSTVFTLVENGKPNHGVYLLSASGHYLAAEASGAEEGWINATRFVPRSWESFERITPNQLNPNDIALRTSTGKYVRKVKTSLRVTGDAISPSAIFTLEIVADISQRLKTTGLLLADPLIELDKAVQSFVNEFEVPATTVCIMKNGKLAMLRGYGYADYEAGKLTLPSTIMRLASVDKPVTRVALEILIEQKRELPDGSRLSKQSKIFPLLRNLYGVQPFGGQLADARINDITVQHVIDHRSGLVRDTEAGHNTPEENASWLMGRGFDLAGNVKLGSEKAERYSNAGYELLRFLMLKITGSRAKFLSFLRNDVFGPVGSTDVGIAEEDLGARDAREPKYSGDGGVHYTRALHLTASAEALARLFTHYQSSQGRPKPVGDPIISAIEIVEERKARVGGRDVVQLIPRYRINCGGDAFRDDDGNFWDADPSDSGWPWSVPLQPIDNTVDDLLYQSLRHHPNYQFPVPDGQYNVTLKFAELWWDNPQQRVFNVAINDETVLSRFDVVAEAGGKYKAIDRTISVAVTGGGGLRISALGNPGEMYWFGSLPGTLAMIAELNWKDLVIITLSNRRAEHMGIIAALMRTAVLIPETEWP